MVMTQYRSLADAKAHFSEVVGHVEAEQEHVFITRHGRPVAVMISVEEYEGLLETLDLMSTPGAREDIAAAERDIANGEYLSAAELRAKYLGEK